LPEPPAPPAPPPGSFSKSVDASELQRQQAWKPGNGPSVRLYPPEVAESSESNSKTPLYLPNPNGLDKNTPPRVDESISTKEPPVAPVGIPQFTRVRDKVATGLRPSLDDGLDWLKAQGYKAVLFLHEPGTTPSSDRKQVEKRGLAFFNLEISPVSLSQQTVDEFNRLVGDSAVLPLYVYDRDGALTGGMWYIHLRQVQHLPDETARKQARQFGLREEREGSHHEMWEAAQKVLNNWQP